MWRYARLCVRLLLVFYFAQMRDNESWQSKTQQPLYVCVCVCTNDTLPYKLYNFPYFSTVIVQTDLIEYVYKICKQCIIIVSTSYSCLLSYYIL